MANPLRIFTNSRYRLYFGGQLISQVGTWMQMVALSWLSYRLSGSPLMLSLVAVSSQLPSLVVMPFAGVIADRFNRHRIIIITNCCAMLEATILATLTLSGVVQIWHLIALGLFTGVVNAFDMPTRTAFVVDLADDPQDLPAAVALNATLMNVSRLIGPALAGFVVAWVGEGLCFAANAASYIAVIGAMLAIKGDFSPHAQTERPGVIAQLKDGLRYAMNTSPIRAVLLFMSIFGFLSMAYTVLMPVFVKQIGGNANTLGYLMSASAVGSVTGSVLLASRCRVLGLSKWLIGGAIGFSLCLMTFSFVHSFWFAVAILPFMGATMMLQIAAGSTILQALVEDDKRGRVMSLYVLSFMGTAPIGSLIAGAVADRVGFSLTMLFCGGYCLLVALIFAALLPRLRKEARPLYVQRGLIAAEEERELLSSP